MFLDLVWDLSGFYDTRFYKIIDIRKISVQIEIANESKFTKFCTLITIFVAKIFFSFFNLCIRLSLQRFYLMTYIYMSKHMRHDTPHMYYL